ncbi:C25 family cysteine peptidase [Spirosoma montaniterrae]|uniref:Gingipain domain-containing protein n=1 Tax=Spirosoma montaniterrae TaxID=1178516 RepID=A0A1P9WVP0_9BACT|nr:C25 family cysteine peptidase [Spirosoma montaniterrae]AQG79456.1 hypothetical protein AWR27_09065 [Spirosoma montaniterrae]
MFARFVLPLLLITSSLTAQSVLPSSDPTRWINYYQSYVKIPVAQSGLYRISAGQLRQAGVPTNAIDPRTIQLFHRGIEQAIFISGETNGQFDADDYIEFYGRANDGLADSALYRPTSAQPHTYYSLFSDTTAYFLTWRLDGMPGRRMAAYTDTTGADLTPEPFHWAEDRRVFTDTYPGYATGLVGKTEFSHYEAGEGYTGPIQQKDKPYDTAIPMPNAYRNGPRPETEILLVGREFQNHHVECFAGPLTGPQWLLDSIRFSGYDNARIKQLLDWQQIDAGNWLRLSTVSRGVSSETDRYSISYLRVRYPQRLTVGNQPLYRLELPPNPAGRSLMVVGDVLPDTRFFDITEPNAPVCIGHTRPAPATARLVVRGTDIRRTILSSSHPLNVTGIRPVLFQDFSRRRPTYLIISHEDLMQPTTGSANPVRDYAAYRASIAGGSFDTLTVTMTQLIDQFSYGERHPLAIRRFAGQLLHQSRESAKRPHYLLLLGRGRLTPGVRRNPDQARLDLVMTMGFPASDALFTAGLDGFAADVPAIPTGRVNAGSPQEVLAYLDKVTEYENQTNDQLWRKNWLHLSGGRSPGEVELFRSLVDGYAARATAEPLGAQVSTVARQTTDFVEPVDVSGPVNAGVGLMTFFGHSGLDVTDVDIGFCSNDALGYRNRGRYPVLLINGCAVGNFFFGRPTLSADWILTPRRGAIACLAPSHLSYAEYLDQYSTEFYKLLTDSTQLHKSIGQLQQETIRRVLARSSDGGTVANVQQMVLQGDPAIRPFPFQTPDYAISVGGLQILGDSSQPLTAQSDSVRIRAVVQNSSLFRGRSLPVRVRRFVNEQETGIYNLRWPRAVAFRDTLVLTLPNERNAVGSHRFEITLNPLGDIAEDNRANNTATAELNVSGSDPNLANQPNTHLPDGVIFLANAPLRDVYQGDTVTVTFGLANLGPVSFTDSLTVRQTLYAASQTVPLTQQWRIGSPQPGDTLRFTTRLPTESLPGLNRLVLTVNPRILPEYSFANNTLNLALPVQPDTRGPLLEVAIDGARIENDAVVSARPIIDLLVADDNRALLRRDTSGIDLFLQRPGSNRPFERLSWRGSTSRPAGPDNVFRLRYASPDLPDGTYHLLATAHDALGNRAAPYRVQFRILRERLLTDFTAYPNPFRDQILFSTQLTGDRAPDSLLLTISDLAGRIIRRFRQHGRIGLNELVWDGRAESGESLPAGLYFYTLQISDSGAPWPIADAAQGKLSGRILLVR